MGLEGLWGLQSCFLGQFWELTEAVGVIPLWSMGQGCSFGVKDPILGKGDG